MTNYKNYLFIYLFCIWNIAIWIPRLRNIYADTALTGAPRIVALFIAATFILGACATLLLATLWVRSSNYKKALTVFGPAFCIVAIVRWGSRTPFVLFGEETSAFKIVHTILAAVTLVLALAALRQFKKASLLPKFR